MTGINQCNTALLSLCLLSFSCAEGTVETDTPMLPDFTDSDTVPDLPPDIDPGDSDVAPELTDSDACIEHSDCAGTLKCCDGRCVDAMSSLDHCGDCNQSCLPFANMCISGVCSCNSAARCSDPKHCCSGGCTDVTSDSDHCGECDRECPAGNDCEAGTCVESDCDPACIGEHEICCAGRCYDSWYDDHNCGGCGVDCPDGQTCVSGVCEVSLCVPPCAGGDVCCTSTCVNVLTDESNCGSCGI